MWTPSSPHFMSWSTTFANPGRQKRPGSESIPLQSEVITLAIFARWSRFASERDFYRYATDSSGMPSPPCPIVPSSTASYASYRPHREFRLESWALLQSRQASLPSPGQLGDARRDAKRRGHGWLAGQADIGWSNSIGWYEGFSLLTAVDPTGVITGFCFGAASTADQPLAETFFDLRANPNPRLGSVGAAFSGAYVADKGFEGAENHRRWLECYGARGDPSAQAQLQESEAGPSALRRWVASIRQIVETVYDKLFNTFGLWRERPHEIEGLRARLAARVALHNFCIWLNDHLGRPRLKFADLMGW